MTEEGTVKAPKPPLMVVSVLTCPTEDGCYQRVRTAETNSAVVEAHGGVTAARRTEPAKNHGNKWRNTKVESTWHMKLVSFCL